MPQPTIESTGTIATTGIGKPDYTEKVSSALQRAGYRLEVGQSLKLFFLTPSSLRLPGNPYPWVTDPIAVGGSAHLVDAATGLTVPYAVAQGFGLSVIEKSWALNHAATLWFFMDGHVAACSGQSDGRDFNYQNNVFPYTTQWIDPTGAIAHTVDAVVYNQGSLDALEGGISLICILESISTPPLPTTKTIRCHVCGKQEEVPAETTRWICRQCGQLLLFVNDRALGRSP